MNYWVYWKPVSRREATMIIKNNNSETWWFTLLKTTNNMLIMNKNLKLSFLMGTSRVTKGLVITFPNVKHKKWGFPISKIKSKRILKQWIGKLLEWLIKSKLTMKISFVKFFLQIMSTPWKTVMMSKNCEITLKKCTKDSEFNELIFNSYFHF